MCGNKFEMGIRFINKKLFDVISLAFELEDYVC